MKYAFIRENDQAWSVRLLSRLLGVHPSGYYAWLHQPLVLEKQRRSELIRQSWYESGCEYGYRRIYEDLRDSGEACSLSQVRTILKKVRAEGITSTNDLGKPYFRPPLPNLRLVTGTSGLMTGEGVLYLSIIIDLYSGRIVGQAMSESNRRELPLQALQSMLMGMQPQQKMLVHVDDCFQFTHREWRNALRRHDLARLICQRGACRELQRVTDFFQLLQDAKMKGAFFETSEEACQQILSFINLYNQEQGAESELNPLLPILTGMTYAGFDPAKW